LFGRKPFGLCIPPAGILQASKFTNHEGYSFPPSI
jgi:hypothetical protein